MRTGPSVLRFVRTGENRSSRREVWFARLEWNAPMAER